MRYTIISISILLLLVVLACNVQNNAVQQSMIISEQHEQKLLDKARVYLDSLPELPNISADKMAMASIDLGRKLFLDKRLSLNETKSCNSCHDLTTYGVDNEALSLGFDNVKGTRNTPSVYNATFALAQFWDGRAADLAAQARSPILDATEMGMPDEKTLVQRLIKDPSYQKMFAAAFPAHKNPVSFENISTAIGKFEERLISYAPFDDYLNGKITALNEQEKRGLNAFIDLGCIPCHSGSATGGNMYQKFPQIGRIEDYTGRQNKDEGRYADTKNAADKRIFKVPSLRNVAKTAPYFHDGSVATLPEAVKIMAKAQLNTDLSSEEIADIVAFLQTLTGDISGF